MADRQQLMQNAIAFLADPKTQSSTLAQRVQFLEAKGLTGPEIEDAMRQSNSSGAMSSQSYGYPYLQQQPYGAYGGYARGQAHWDWRDYFITAVVSGTVVSGVTALARKYLFPHLQPPNTTAYEADRDALTAQFDAAAVLLADIQAETAAVRAAVDAQQARVEAATDAAQAAVAALRSGEAATRDELREIRSEVDSVRAMLPKMIEKSKDAEKQTLAELQQELKSLKALLLSRSSGLPSAPASPAPTLPYGIGRPTIPAWQLAPTASESSAPSATPSPALDKGKAPERPTSTEIPP